MRRGILVALLVVLVMVIFIILSPGMIVLSALLVAAVAICHDLEVSFDPALSHPAAIRP